MQYFGKRQGKNQKGKNKKILKVVFDFVLFIRPPPPGLPTFHSPFSYQNSSLSSAICYLPSSFPLPSALSLVTFLFFTFPLPYLIFPLLSALPSLFSSLLFHLSSLPLPFRLSPFSSLPLVYFHSPFSPLYTVSSLFSPLLKGFPSLELTQTGAVRGWRRRYRRVTGEVASLL
jgi:hypothetical protein